MVPVLVAMPLKGEAVKSAFEGARGTGEICLNGAAARLAAKGDIIIILTYCQVEDDQSRHFLPKLVYVDAKNTITETKQAIETTPF